MLEGTATGSVDLSREEMFEQAVAMSLKLEEQGALFDDTGAMHPDAVKDLQDSELWVSPLAAVRRLQAAVSAARRELRRAGLSDRAAREAVSRPALPDPLRQVLEGCQRQFQPALRRPRLRLHRLGLPRLIDQGMDCPVFNCLSMLTAGCSPKEWVMLLALLFK